MRKAAIAAVAVGVVLLGAGRVAAQYGYPPPMPPSTTTPTNTTPTYTTPPDTAPTYTSPAPAPTTTPGRNTVTIKGSGGTYRFSPSTLRLRKGKRAKWSWSSDAPHNVTFRRLRRHSRTGSRGSFGLTFHKRGTYRYVCTIHGFTGKVVVR